MKTIEISLLELLSWSQFETSELEIYECDWTALLDESKIQSVMGLVVSAIPKQVKDENPEFENILYRQFVEYTRYCYAETELIGVLGKSSIPLVILKGNAAAIAYKEPYLRSMGDIDFMVPQDYFSEARRVLDENGYKEIHDCGRHIEYQKNGVAFELHHHFSEGIDIESYIIDGLSNITIRVIGDHEFPMLPKLANGLVLLDHMGRHLKSGLGLRQVIDWMMYVYRELDDEFWEKEFSKVAKEKGLDTLAIVTTRMCQIYMGLPETITWCKDADEKVCELLIENLLASGNFGRKQGKGSSVETVSTSIKRKGLFRWLQYAGEYNWEAYHKHHWLKPFCWFYQIFRYAKQGFKSGRSREELSGDLNRSEQRYELLKKLGIE